MSVMSVINIRVDVSFQTALKVKFTHSCHTRCSCFLSSDEKKLRFLKNKTFSFLQIVDFNGTKRVQIAISVQLQRFYTIPAKEQGSYQAKHLFIFLKKNTKNIYIHFNHKCSSRTSSTSSKLSGSFYSGSELIL